MENLFFDNENHKYYYLGEKVSCTSDVLKIIDCIAMNDIPVRNIMIAGEKGTRIHEETENYDCGLLDVCDKDWLLENEDIEPYVKCYIDFACDYKSIPIAMEIPLYSEEIGIAGTIDLVKEINGELALIDKKTGSIIYGLRSMLQLNIYRLIWNKTHKRQIEKLYILHLQKDKPYRLIPINIDEQKSLDYIKQYFEIKNDKKI